jgi:general secretion pathway protein K
MANHDVQFVASTMKSSHRLFGSALVLVLWLVAALSLVVMAGVKTIRQQTDHIGAQLNSIRAEFILDGATQLIAQRMLASPDLANVYRWLLLELDGQRVWVEVTPADGLVDVVVASEELLRTFIERVSGLSPDDSQVLTSRIRDWIDPDDQPSGAGGAESPQYRMAGWPTAPRNGPPEDSSELRSVMGMTPEVYDKIAPYLGLNGQQRLHLESTPPELVDQLTGEVGMGEKVLRTPQPQRASLLQSFAAKELFIDAPGAGLRDIRLRAFLVSSEEDRWWHRETWISLAPRPDTLTPWTTLLVNPIQRIPKPNDYFMP